jgi:hypothetical protein
MSLATLSSRQLHQLVALVKEKESLQARLAQIAQSLERLSGTVDKPLRVAKRQITRRRRKALKARLLKALQVAGKDGLSIKELAAKLKAKPGSVGVWLYTTGKRIKAIKKAGRGRFVYLGNGKS